MKKFLFALGLIASVVPAWAQQIGVQDVVTETAAEQMFVQFDYQGFTMQVPAGCEVNLTTKEAVLKCGDGTFGMSVKVEKDKGASAEAAVEMCRRMVRELDVKDSKITKVMIHGMQGGKLEGTTEGAPVSVLILATKGKYIKVVVINTPEHADWVNITLDSLAPLS